MNAMPMTASAEKTEATTMTAVRRPAMRKTQKSVRICLLILQFKPLDLLHLHDTRLARIYEGGSWSLETWSCYR
jgi:hypothetical protein